MSKCTECKEYDKDKHYCPKWCDVIKSTIEDARADERKKVLEEVDKYLRELSDIKSGCGEWIEEYDEQVRADEKEKVLEEVWGAFNNEWVLDSLACHENKYEILAIIKRQIEQLKEQNDN